jgi:hypothetical protein
MNNAATSVSGWIEHEEAILFRLAKTVQLNFDRIIVPAIGIGLFVWVVSLFLTVFLRYGECSKIIALCAK